MRENDFKKVFVKTVQCIAFNNKGDISALKGRFNVKMLRSGLKCL